MLLLKYGFLIFSKINETEAGKEIFSYLKLGFENYPQFSNQIKNAMMKVSNNILKHFKIIKT